MIDRDVIGRVYWILAAIVLRPRVSPREVHTGKHPGFAFAISRNRLTPGSDDDNVVGLPS